VFGLFNTADIWALDDLERATGISRHETVKAAGRLIERGYLKRTTNGVFALTQYGADAIADGVVIRSGPMGPDTAIARPPVRDTLRQRAWTAMRVMAKFSTVEIASACLDVPQKKDQDNIRRYCRGLKDAGILIEMPTREGGSALTSNGFKRYRICEDLGEIAPSHRVRKKDVFDHNNRKVFPCLSK
jgi:hypothetical protein